jgi:hypothetical protein
MPTVKELNAGFDAASDTLTKLINVLAPDVNFPFVGNPRQLALGFITCKQGRLIVLGEVKSILLAAEAARAVVPPPKKARKAR